MLTQEMISAAFPVLPADDPEAMRLLSDDEVTSFLEEALAAKPAEQQECWVFAYGSLMWKREANLVEPRIATIRGWHRRFCLWQWRFRGTPTAPSLMLGLDRGGSCHGMIYRIAGPVLSDAIAPVWWREMRANGYRARWVKAETDEGSVWAVTFIAHRNSERYAGRLPDVEIADRIALACGHIGSGAEYLLHTFNQCEQLGVRDSHLSRIYQLVTERLSKRVADVTHQKSDANVL
jgi:cation transport protein ChaC